MKKIYILDTNVLLVDSQVLYKFGHSNIVLPYMVLEELDKKKNLHDIIGSNARAIIRQLDELRKKGNLSSGVKISKGLGFLSIENYNIDLLPKDFDLLVPDNKIIAVAFKIRHESAHNKIIVISRDINVRVKCNTLGFLAEDYEINKIIEKKEELYSGVEKIEVEDIIVDNIYNNMEVFLEKELIELYSNQFVMLTSKTNPKKSVLTRFFNYDKPLKKVLEYKNGISEIKCKNKEQLFAANLLMDPKVEIVSLVGPAGSGKTVISLAAGLEQTIGKNPTYKRFIVIRPIMPLGKDIGFLPGTIQEKLEPWIMPIVDNLRFLFGNDKTMLEEYIKNGVIEIEAMTYIRGRSISDAFILIDEAQNLSNHEIKTILTRAGEKSKIVLTGDLEQIDCSYLNETTSGLTNVIEKFKLQDISGHVTLHKGERSLLATIASKIL